MNGWIDLPDSEQASFADAVSDHCSLLVRIETGPGSGSVTTDVVISGALVNPVGTDRERETVTLRNRGEVDVALGGWTLRDRADRIEMLRGSVPAHGSVTFGLSTARLANAGGTIALINPQGVIVDDVSYERQAAGTPVLFP